LVLAIARLPYAYYTFTRVVTFVAAALIAYFGFLEKRRVVQVWSGLLVGIAVLFNPIVPIHLNRTTWLYLDLGAAAVFLAHLVFVRNKLDSSSPADTSVSDRHRGDAQGSSTQGSSRTRVEDDHMLRRYGWSDEDLQGMSPSQRTAALEEALKLAAHDRNLADGSSKPLN